MDGFSSATRLTDLSDLNQSSQMCINPVQIEKSNQKKRAVIELEDDGSYIEIDDGKKNVLPSAKISLNDCLACSGCVTTAESILIAAQSTTEFYQNLNKIKEGYTVVVSLSPQSRASVAAYFNISALQAHKKLITLFKTLGVSYVFDTSFSREFSLLESAAEFVARKRESLIDAPLPFLTSACPGWICYAEKNQPLSVPLISTTKSPQQIMGSIVKYYFAPKKNIRPEQVYHVAIMPCFDKKLEASRDDFYNDIYKTHDVDCVLSSLEILDILKDKNIDFMSLEESPIENLFTNVNGDTIFGTTGGSGGYLEYVFRYAAKVLYNIDVTEIKYTQVGRSPDFKEVQLEVDGKKVLHFAQMYNFKNINNLVRKIKDKKCPYDFVEVMACPSGCVNGGGQLRSSTKENPKALLARVEAAYNESQHTTPEQNTPAMELFNLWKSGPFEADPHTSLHTKYHIREKTVNPLSIGW